MPKKAKRPCGFPGCPELADEYYCPKHKDQIRKKAGGNYNRQRTPDTYKRYGRQWKKIRSAFLSENPMCEKCKRNGKLVPAQEVHHILPISQGGTHERNNLMALCKSCHSEITAKDTHGARSWEDTEGRGYNNLHEEKADNE